MTAILSKLWSAKSVLIFTVILYSLLQGYFLNNDFWQDEIYTLEHFVFTTWDAVLTDYHSTNNHIAFNVVLKLFAVLVNVNSVRAALDQPYWLRFVPYMFSMLSLVLFYKGANKHYGKAFATTGLSIFCTTIVFIDFGAQLRGYSMSIFLTVIQYFVFLEIVKEDGGRWNFVKLFLITCLSLLCLPTNVYIALAYLLFCLVVLLIPGAAIFFRSNNLSRVKAFTVAAVISVAVILVLLYYNWLLKLQPENPLITSLKMFDPKNLLQSLAIFFHFTDNRFYFYLFLAGWLVIYLKGLKYRFYASMLFPAFLFFIPFVIFCVHGATIIQRTFLSLLPFFALIVTSAVEDVYKSFNLKNLRVLFYIMNVFVLIWSFSLLLDSSNRNNKLSIHKHDLRNHYYLVNFNAKEVSIIAGEIIKRKKVKLYVWDDYGKTGVKYYLSRYNVPFEWFNQSLSLQDMGLILTNNKKDIEKILLQKGVSFTKLLSTEVQYNLYLLYK